MHALDTENVAKLLHELGLRTSLRGGSPYRARAYLRAAESLRASPIPIADLIAQKRLRELPGVGETIADIVSKLHARGSHPALEELRGEVPSGVLDLLTIPGLRPDKVMKLYRELGVCSLEELERAAKGNRLQPIKGLGAALQAKILQGLEIRRQSAGRRHLHRAAALLQSAAAQLRRMKGFRRITPAGDFRRGCELVSDLTLVAETENRISEQARLNTPGQLFVDGTDTQHYGITLLLATGSEKHLAGLRALASARGMALTKEGLRKGRKLVAGKSEEGIYAALGLPFIEPELREGRGEIELAQSGKLPQLVSDGDLRGILHAHTDRSDGVDTLEVMAKATQAAGYEYFGVADHSRSAHYAGGLSIEEIAEQHAEIDVLNKRFGDRFHVFKGIEADILADGSLDYHEDVLTSFDFVVASVHSRFKMGREEQTERIIRAVRNPRTTILGHMTGRQLLRRPGYDVDIEKVLAACAGHGVAVEINANPWRLDLDWRWHQRALELGCLMSINPDAHDTREIELTHWGVEMARKGGMPKNRVLNCLDRTGLAAYLKDRSKQTPGRQSRRRS
jgi:DNA polymerase (family X)